MQLPNISQYRNKFILFTGLTTFFLIISSIIIIINLFENRIDSLLESEHQKNHNSIKVLQNNSIKRYDYLLQRMLLTPSVEKYFKNKKRDKLHKALELKWKLLQEENPYLTTLTFHNPDGTVFLRMHKPNHFDDNVGIFRPMVKEVHKNHKQLMGYESGVYSTVQRIITPLFDATGSYIGAIDIGINPNYLITQLKEILDKNAALFINDKSLPMNKNLSGNLHLKNYTLIGNVDSQVTKIIKKLILNNYDLSRYTRVQSDEGTQYVHLFPILNYKGEMVAQILFFYNLSVWESLRQFLLLLVISIISIFSLFILFFSYRAVFQIEKTVKKLYTSYLKELEDSQKNFKQLFEAAPLSYQSLDSDGKIVEVNDQWLKELGYSKEEIIGKNFADIIAPNFRDKFHENFPTFKANGHIKDIQFDMLTKFGKTINTSHSGKIIYNTNKSILKTHCIFINVTQRNEHLKTIAFNEAYLDSIFNTMPNIIFTTYGKKIDRANQKLLDFTKYDSLAMFKEAHHCFCEYFEVADGYVSSHMDTQDWLDYVYDNPQIQHRVKIKYEDTYNIYILNAHQLSFDDEERSIVLLNDITELENLSTSLQNSNDLTTSIIDSMDNLVFVKDTNLNYLECNRPFQRLVNRSKVDIIGFNDYDLFDKEIADAYRLLDTEMFTSRTVKSKFEWVTYPDGKKVYLLTTALPLISREGNVIGSVGSSVDITKQKNLEDELKVSEQRYKTFFDSSQAVILQIEPETGDIVEANTAAEKFYGYTHSQLLQMNIGQINMGTEERMYKHRQEAKNNECNYFEFTQQLSSGEMRDVAVYSGPIEDDNQVYLLSIIHDITFKHQMEKELKNKEDIMLAQSRNAAMGEMIGMIAHQWRQPITSIAMGANNIIVDSELGNIEKDSLYKQATEIVDLTQYLSQTIDDFRNFFKPKKERNDTNVCRLVDESLSIIRPSLINNNIEVIKEFNSTSTISTYSRELLQVFINIIKNAKEALAENKVKNAKITITVTENDKNIITTICDNAGGIKPELLTKIFEPYFTTKDAQIGTGLGLYMSSIIVNKHLHGILNVKNTKEGVCFIVTIPKTVKTDRED